MTAAGEPRFKANMVAQRDVRAQDGMPPIRYDAVRRCSTHLAEQAALLGASVHMPRIGYGLAGGSWPEVQALIEETLVSAGIRVRAYDP